MTHPDIAPVLDRLRGQRWPYLSRSEADALLPWLTAAIEGGDTWAMWIRGRIADGNLLPRDPDLARSLWQRGHDLGSAPCTFELGHLAERSRDRDQAARLYESAAAAGSAPAALRRGHIAAQRASSETWRLGGDEVAALWSEAERWYRRAVELGGLDAWGDVAFAVRCRPGVTDDDMVACEGYRALAAAAAPDDRVARILADVGGSDTPSLSPIDLPTLLPWLADAVGRGDGWAAWLLGRLVDSGDAPGGAAEALAHWQRGAELGDARCMFELGFRIEKKKKKEATALYERSAAGGCALAALRLGHAAKTWKDAERWYRHAIALGRDDAWIDLARLLTSGAKGAPIDLAQAAQCWERAAEGGSTGALGFVVEMLDEGAFMGQPVARDPVRLRRLAEQGMDLGVGGGVARCQYVLAKMMAAGEGGPVDREGAALWSRVAGGRSDHASERAKALYEEVWATLDDDARRRVDARAGELYLD